MSYPQNARRGRPRFEGMRQPAFPYQQLAILAACRICEPIAFMSIFPYIYYMISSFNITNDARQIAIYAGMVTSAFAFAEFSTSVLWGRLSDRIGRKPVLISGLAGTAVSMIIFGFSTNLPMAIIGRAMGGFLNGNIGVLQTTVAELVKVKEHQPRAYSVMPFVWCLGSILGPALGGALAQPCIGYPSIFPQGGLFDRYPFLLPNLVCTIILVIGVAVGILFLEETHEDLKERRDLGLESGRWILGHLVPHRAPPVTREKAPAAFIEEVEFLLEDEELSPGYSPTEGSPQCPSTRNHSPAKNEKMRRHCGAQTAFTRQVITTVVSYGILAFHTISFDQLMPVFLSSPVAVDAPELPFKFNGGFGLSSKTIGVMFSVQGLYSMVAQLFLFPFLVKRLGTLRCFRLVVCTWPLLYFLVPYAVLLPRVLQMPAIMFCLIWRITAQVTAFPSNMILLANSAPSLMVLGMINGVAASAASLSRAISPTLSGIVHSWGLSLGYVGIAFWIGGLVAVIGAIESFWIEEGKGRMDVEVSTTNSSVTTDPARNEPLLDPVSIENALNAAAAADQTDKSAGVRPQLSGSPSSG